MGKEEENDASKKFVNKLWEYHSHNPGFRRIKFEDDYYDYQIHYYDLEELKKLLELAEELNYAEAIVPIMSFFGHEDGIDAQISNVILKLSQEKSSIKPLLESFSISKYGLREIRANCLNNLLEPKDIEMMLERIISTIPEDVTTPDTEGLCSEAMEELELLLDGGIKEAVVPYILAAAKYSHYVLEYSDNFKEDYVFSGGLKSTGWGQSIVDTTKLFSPSKRLTDKDIEDFSKLLESDDKEIRGRTIPFLCRILNSTRDKRIFRLLRNQIEKYRFYSDLDIWQYYLELELYNSGILIDFIHEFIDEPDFIILSTSSDHDDSIESNVLLFTLKKALDNEKYRCKAAVIIALALYDGSDAMYDLFETEEAQRALVDATEDDNPVVRWRAMSILQNYMKPDYMEYLSEFQDEECTEKLKETMKDLTKEKTADFLIEALQSEEGGKIKFLNVTLNLNNKFYDENKSLIPLTLFVKKLIEALDVGNRLLKQNTSNLLRVMKRYFQYQAKKHPDMQVKDEIKLINETLNNLS